MCISIIHGYLLVPCINLNILPSSKMIKLIETKACAIFVLFLTIRFFFVNLTKLNNVRKKLSGKNEMIIFFHAKKKTIGSY